MLVVSGLQCLGEELQLCRTMNLMADSVYKRANSELVGWRAEWRTRSSHSWLSGGVCSQARWLAGSRVDVAVVVAVKVISVACTQFTDLLAPGWARRGGGGLGGEIAWRCRQMGDSVRSVHGGGRVGEGGIEGKL
ncbi:hypothetical protein ACTXT7_006389, partial [Hymenolepis weldensis]